MSDPAAAPLENPIILNLMGSFGCFLIGSFLSQAIWGISTMQTFLYFKNYDNDRRSLKLLVAALWLMDTLDQIFILKGNFKVLILQYGRIAGLAENANEIIWHTWVESIVIFIVQLYFVRRIYLFGKKHKLVVVFCVILALLAAWQAIGILVYWVLAYGKPFAEQLNARNLSINVSLRACAVTADVSIAIAMVWLLTQGSKGPRLARTKKMMFRILMITINSGTWTALVALISLILMKAKPNDPSYCAADFALCSLYFSTMLANLNARNYITGDDGVTTISVSDLSGTNPTLVLGPMRGGRTNMSTTIGSDLGKGVAVYTESGTYGDDGHPTSKERAYGTP